MARPQGSDDPFAEPPEPRMPKTGAPEEKVEFFRAVLRQKTETLARARALYADRDLEADTLRRQLEAATRTLAEAQAQLLPLKDLPQRLSEASAQLARESARAQGAEKRAAALQQELDGSEGDRRD